MCNILFVNNTKHLCGVHQYGFNIGNTIIKSPKYNFIYIESEADEEVHKYIRDFYPKIIIYNYHSFTLSWAQFIIDRYKDIRHLSIIHEPLDYPNNLDGTISQDPTIIETNNHFKTGRLIFDYINNFSLPKILTIGSFGFPQEDKGYLRIINQVKEEFNEAIIRFHIPFSWVVDPSGRMGDELINKCLELLKETNIKLEISREWMSLQDLLNWLAKNTINVFFYDTKEGRGISGPPDFALSVQRPIALTKSYMFRHLLNTNPSICIEDLSLKEIIDNGIKPLEEFYNIWSENDIIKDYERIIERILNV